MGIVPQNKPQYKREDAETILKIYKKPLDRCYLIAFRGYYSQTFQPRGNNIGVYDDALVVISPDTFTTFNFNVDPSSQATGRANLCAGIWQFEIGIHNRSKAKSKQYTALIQDEAQFLIKRFNQGTKLESYRGINLHRGGNTTTSSLGCLTVPPIQWDSAINLIIAQMNKHNQKKIELILIDL